MNLTTPSNTQHDSVDLVKDVEPFHIWIIMDKFACQFSLDTYLALNFVLNVCLDLLHSMAKLCSGKYRSVLQLSVLHLNFICLPLNTFLILITDYCSLHNHSSILSSSSLPMSTNCCCFMYLLMYFAPFRDKGTLVLFR